jgi:Protein of unknown function (DUF559)
MRPTLATPPCKGGAEGVGRALPKTCLHACYWKIMTEYFNRSSEKERRRRLRRSMPNAEVVLWSKLKRTQLLGCKFRRQ